MLNFRSPLIRVILAMNQFVLVLSRAATVLVLVIESSLGTADP
jgi:hypothetical protein